MKRPILPIVSACLEMYMPVPIAEWSELNITVILIPIYDEMIESQPGFTQMRKSVPAGWAYTAAAPVCDVSSEGARAEESPAWGRV